MKKLLALLAAYIISYASSYSQTQDLIALSSGDYLGASIVLDEDNDVYGYVSVYSKGKKKSERSSFEAVLLDKNLNKVSNVNLSAPQKTYSFKIYMNVEQDIVFIPYKYSANYYKTYDYLNMFTVDFKSKKTKPYKFQCYKENGRFEDCKTYQTRKEKRKDIKSNYKEKGYFYDSDVYETKNGDLFVMDRKISKRFYDDVSIKAYDEDKKLMWKKKIETEGTKKGFKNVDLFRANSNKSKNIYAVISEFDKKTAKATVLGGIYSPKHWNKLVGYNMETGKQILNKDISGKYENTGQFLARSEAKDYLIDLRVLKNSSGKQIGYRRTKIGLKDNSVKWNDLLFEDMKGKIDRLNKYGAIGGNYKLNPLTAFINNDGSIYILTEEYKLAKNVLLDTYVDKNKDFFLIRTTPSFKLKTVDRIEKDKSKRAYTDFLFWQRLSTDSNDVAFFYSDKRKEGEEGKREKHKVLGVCTIIDGKFKREELKIQSKSEKYTIVPALAKRGYIMLNEYNEKEDYSTVRLERLNY